MRLVCKVLNWMSAQGPDAVTPQAHTTLEPMPLFELTSCYVQRSVSAFPTQGPRAPWQMQQNYVLDAIATVRNDFSHTLRAERRTGDSNAA